MSSLNKAQVIGRLGQDPDIRYTQSNKAVANMSVATSEKWKDQNGEQQEKTEWHKIVAWGKLAEVCQQYLKKGDQVYFEGSLQTRKWQDKEGRDVYTTEILAKNMVMLGSKHESSNEPAQTQPSAAAPIGSNNDLSHLDDIEDDLPF